MEMTQDEYVALLECVSKLDSALMELEKATNFGREANLSAPDIEYLRRAKDHVSRVHKDLGQLV